MLAPDLAARLVSLSPSVSVPDTVLRRDVLAFLARNLYLHYAPDPTDNSLSGVCHDDDGYYMNGAWGLARARVVGLKVDSTGTSASVNVEVLRVLSVEDDNETSDGRYAQADMMIVKPVLATIGLFFRRREDGRWVHCAPVDSREEDGVLSPISLMGPPADTIAPRRKISRVIPAGSTWARVRALADSVARAAAP